jgi:hypothetical protein
LFLEKPMDATLEFPSFDDHLPGLNQFILVLVEEYNAGKIKSWGDLEKEVKSFFTPERMDETESMVPGWKKMASYSEGITLTHVICVFLGLFMLPEFQALTPNQRQLAKWIVLFHDIGKIHVRGKRDYIHGFKSAILTAGTLRDIGFQTTEKFDDVVNSWSDFAKSAITKNSSEEPIQDNSKLPTILAGIDEIYGNNTPAALIVKGVLLHMSINVVKNWPQPAPLSEDEILRTVDNELAPLLKVMMLADNEGWVMFHPESRARQREETLEAFANIEILMNKESA